MVKEDRAHLMVHFDISQKNQSHIPFIVVYMFFRRESGSELEE